MEMRQVFLCAALLVSTLAVPADAQRFIVLPGAGSTATQASAFAADPLRFTGTINTGPGALQAFANSSGTQYFIVTATGVVVVDGSGAQLQTLPISDPVNGAALTPNGRQLVVTAGTASTGSLYIFDVSGATATQSAVVAVGNNPFDVAVNADSSRAFVVTAGAVSAVDLGTKSVAVTTPLAGVAQAGAAKPGITIGPNGVVYVNGQSVVYVIDPTPVSVLSSIPVTGYPGVLSFSPDGTVAAAVNQTAGDPLITTFNVPQNRVLATLTGISVQMTNVFLPSASVVYAISNSKYLYQFDPAAPLRISVPKVANLGSISTAVSGALSPEPEGAKHLYVTTTSGVIEWSLKDNTAASDTLGTGAGPSFLALPAHTGMASRMVQANATQSVALSAKSLPLVVTVVDSNGQPLAGQSIKWTPSGVTLQNQMTTTNNQGVATAIAVAPKSAGTYKVTAAILSSAVPAATFTLAVGSGGGGGGGTIPTAGINMISGNGQVAVSFFNTAEPLVVRVLDSTGTPVAKVPVTFQAGGSGGIPTIDIGQVPSQSSCTPAAGGGLTCPSDANGYASVFFQAPGVVFQMSSYLPSTVTASIGSGSGLQSGSVMFNVTAIPTQSDSGGFGILPLVTQISPSPGSSILPSVQQGQTLANAFQVQVNAQSGPQVNVALPNVGLTVRDTFKFQYGATPDFYCQGGTVLTNTQGVAICNLVVPASTPVGVYTVYRVVGGFQSAPFTLNVTAAPPPAAVATTIDLTAGNGQSGAPGATLPTALTATVKDQFGKPMANATVAWAVVSGQATLNNPSAKTNSSGQATATVVLGSTAGQVQIRVTSGTASNTFTETVTIAITSITAAAGSDNQTAVVSTAFKNPLTVQVNSANGPVPGVPVTFAITSGSAVLNGGPTMSTNSNGQASLTVNAGPAAGPVKITATASGQTYTFNLTVRPAGPQLTQDSFLNGASFQKGEAGKAAFSFGSIVTIIAPGLASSLNLPAGQCVSGPNGAGPLPTTVSGMQILFGSIAAPIFAICQNADGTGQANVQAPFELAPGTMRVTVRSGVGGTVSEAYLDDVPVANAVPGIFEWVPAGGDKIAVAVKPNGTYASPDNPAHPGEVIRIYTTGLGPVNPWVGTNQPGAPGQVPYFTPLAQLGDTGMGGVTGEYAQNTVGIFVISFQIPSNQATGAAVPLKIGVTRNDGSTVLSQLSHIPIQP